MGLHASRLPLPRAGPGARDAPLREGGPAAPAVARMNEKLSARSRELLASGRVAHLATADQYASPHVVPIVFVYEHPLQYTPIDANHESGDHWHELRPLRNGDTN